MEQTARRKAVYDDLYSIPENMTGEIIEGELYATPRPSRKHSRVASTLGYAIGPSYDFGDGGGPGGWIILHEPEIAFGDNILVPDLAGWKKERFPVEEDHNWISAIPDWVCEVLSPSTLRIDKIKKMSIYAQYGVSHFWLIEPLAKTLDVLRLEYGTGKWTLAGTYVEDDKARAEPFQEIEINLSNLWFPW